MSEKVAELLEEDIKSLLEDLNSKEVNQYNYKDIMNMQIKVQEYFNRQIAEFLTSERCCIQFCESLRPTDNQQLAEFANRYDLRTTRFVYKGMDVLKIHKNACIHYAETPFKMNLRDFSQKELYLFHISSDLSNSIVRLQMTPDYMANNKPKPSLMSFGGINLEQTMVKKTNIADLIARMRTKSNLAQFQAPLMHCMDRSRVVVINGDRSQDKSVIIPLYLLEHYERNRKMCKIFVIEKESLIAICNAERLADIIDEKVGETIAYQVPLQNRITKNSNIIFTTPFYFLRYLIGRSQFESFRHISHIIINDIQDRDAYIDILLNELTLVLSLNPSLNIALLSKSQGSSEFLDYFGMGEEFFLCAPAKESNPSTKIYYIEDIYQINAKTKPLIDSTVAYKALAPSGAEIDSNFHHMDGCLEVYHQYGNSKAFNNIMYMIKGELASINYKHSTYGYSAAIIAAKLGNADHLGILLSMNADPYLMDNDNMNAYSYALNKCNTDMNQILNLYCGDVYLTHDCIPSVVDYSLIMNLLNNLLTGADWQKGHIIVILPSYRHTTRLYYYLLRHQIIGNLPASFGIRLLYSSIDKDSLKEIARPNKSCPMVILSTDFAETATFLCNITYVIDTMRREKMNYNPNSLCNEKDIEWISKDTADNRSKIAGYGMLLNEGKPTCFRIIPKTIYNSLPVKTKAELKTMPLDRICLIVKLISPHAGVAEVLQKCLDPPPFLHTYQTVGVLTKMEVFDDLENITWLGCRLIDIPLPCMLGKLLIMGTTLQCFDPILTIVCVQLLGDPLDLPVDVETSLEPFIINLRQQIKQKRFKLSEGKDSDHLMILRLYEEWQNEQENDSGQLTLVDEYHFVRNRLFERVCEKRLHLVASMRASQMIHNHGMLSMINVNARSNSWPLIKAALVGGMYPNISYVDTIAGRLKSSKSRELMISPSSCLRTLNLINIKILAKSHHSQWIVFGEESNSVTCNSINYCTLVLPITIALFGGPSKLNPHNITNQVPYISNYFIDDFLWLQASFINAQLIFKTRQYFYHIFQNYVQNCANVEKWKNINHNNFFDILEGILKQEDITHGFDEPINIGIRPKAIIRKSYLHFNEFICWTNIQDANTNISIIDNNIETNDIKLAITNHNNNTNDKDKDNDKLQLSVSIENKFQIVKSITYKCLSKHYYVVHIPDNIYYTRQLLKETLEFMIETHGISEDQMIYIFLYSLNPDYFRNVLLARNDKKSFRLYECFRNRVPLYELIDVCLHNYMNVPSFAKMYCGFLDDRVGAIILELFAYRNNWLHFN